MTTKVQIINWQERDDNADDLMVALDSEPEAGYPPTRLQALIRQGGWVEEKPAQE